MIPSDEDEQIAKNIYVILSAKFSGWFNVRWITFEYVKRFGEINSKRIASVLESMVADGVLDKQFIENANKKIKYHSAVRDVFDSDSEHSLK